MRFIIANAARTPLNTNAYRYSNSFVRNFYLFFILSTVEINPGIFMGIIKRATIMILMRLEHNTNDYRYSNSFVRNFYLFFILSAVEINPGIFMGIIKRATIMIQKHDKQNMILRRLKNVHILLNKLHVGHLDALYHCYCGSNSIPMTIDIRIHLLETSIYSLSCLQLKLALGYLWQ